MNNLCQDGAFKKPIADPVKKVEQTKKSEESKEKSVVKSMKTVARLYMNPVFLLISVCMATYVFIFIPIMTSMVDYSQDKGLPETVGKYLIHAMAVGDVIGKLLLSDNCMLHMFLIKLTLLRVISRLTSQHFLSTPDVLLKFNVLKPCAIV